MALIPSLPGSALFDDPETALRSIDTPSLDLEPCQAVCGVCRYVFWAPLGACPTCHERNR